MTPLGWLGRKTSTQTKTVTFATKYAMLSMSKESLCHMWTAKKQVNMHICSEPTLWVAMYPLLLQQITGLLCQVWFRDMGTFIHDTEHHITKTCLYNFDPLKPHFYIIKLGFTGVNVFFILLKTIDCEYWLELPLWGSSNKYPQSIFWAEIIRIFVWKLSVFGGEIFNIFE